MDATRLAQRAYGQDSQPIRTYRGIEYDAFARITRTLKNAKEKGKLGFADLAAAVHDNRKLWTVLASDVASDNNALPSELRARIFYLAEFTQTYSRKVLNSGASPEPLIDINTAVMSGLRDGSKQE